jgi:hypothetical protein
MTDEMLALRGLMEKTPDADLLREMIGFAAQRLMELEVGGLSGAARGEKILTPTSKENARSRRGEAGGRSTPPSWPWESNGRACEQLGAPARTSHTAFSR